MTEPRTPFNVKCGACQHVWQAAMLPMPLARMASLLKGLHCPDCGADSKQIYADQGGSKNEPTRTTT